MAKRVPPRPRLKQVLQLAAQPGGLRASKVAALDLGTQVHTLCTLLARYARSGLLFQHGSARRGTGGGGYWYTTTPDGHDLLAHARAGIMFANEHRSLTGRVRKYFRDNPAEEVEHADLALKLGESIERVRSAVNGLCKHGELYTAHVIRLVPAPIAALRVMRRAA